MHATHSYPPNLLIHSLVNSESFVHPVQIHEPEC